MQLADLEVLQSEVAVLDRALLGTVVVQPPDDLSQHERIAIRAYLILSHAAIEEFTEACFRDYVRATLRIDDAGMVSAGMYLALIELADPIKGRLQRSVRTPEQVLALFPELYQAKLSANNGVRRHHLQAISQAAGIDWLLFEDSLDLLVQALETLGTKRGGIAHVSTAVHPGTNGGGVVEELLPPNVREYVGDALRALPSLIQFLGDHPAGAVAPTGSLDRMFQRFGGVPRWLKSCWATRPR